MSASNGETVNETSISGSQHSAARLGSVIYLSLVGVIGLIANGLVIAAFWRYHKLRAATKNLFILNLAVCDLVLATLDTTFSISSSFRGKWLYGSAGCYFYGFFHYFFISNTVSTLAVISVDRFYYITKPGRAHTSIITKFRACVLIGMVYAYTFVFTIPPVIGWNSFVEEKHFFSGCYIDYSDQSAASISYSLTASVFLFLFPLTVMLYCYVKIFLAVRNSTRRTITRQSSVIGVAGNTTRKKFPLMKRTHIQTAKMIVMAVFFSMIVWVPYVLVSLIKAFSGGNNGWSVASHITVLIAKSCVIYNVLIYVVLNHKFKVAVFDMVCCGKLSKGTFLDKYMIGTSARQRLSRILSDTDRDAMSQTVDSQRNRVTVANSQHQRWSLPNGLLEGKDYDSSSDVNRNQHGHHLHKSVEFDKEISFQNLRSGENNMQLKVNIFESVTTRDNELESATIKPLKSSLKNSPRTPDKLVMHAVGKGDEKRISVKETEKINDKTAAGNVGSTGVNVHANSENKVSTLFEAKQTALRKLRALSKRKLPDTPQNLSLPTNNSQGDIDVSDKIDTTKGKCEHRQHVGADKGGRKEISTSSAANCFSICSENVNQTQPARQNCMLGTYKLVRAASQRKNGGIAPLKQSRHLNSKREISSARESIRSLYSRRESLSGLKDTENRCRTLQSNSRGSLEKGSILKRNSKCRRSENYWYGSKRTKSKAVRRYRSPSKHRSSNVNSPETSSKDLENIQDYWKRMSLCLDDLDLDEATAVPV